MATTKLGFVGLEDLKEKLEQIPLAVQRRLLNKGVRQAAELLQEKAKELCPVAADENYPDMEPGALRDNIRVYRQRRHEGKGEVAFFVVSRPPLVHRNASKTVPLDYGFWVEYGHSTRGGKTDGGKRIKGVSFVPAHPYMRPAAEATQDQMAQVIQDSINDLVTNYLNKLEQKRLQVEAEQGD